MKALISRHRFEVLGLAIALLFSSLHWWADNKPVVEREAGSVVRGLHQMEGRALDMKFRLRGPEAPHPDVVVVVVDEKSVQKYGRWPWSRARVAQALVRMHEAGVAAVGMDMFFTDEGQHGAEDALRQALADFDREAQAADGTVQLAHFRETLARRAAASEDADLARAFAAPEVIAGVAAYPELDLFPKEKMEEQRALLEPHLLKRFPAENGLSEYQVALDQLPLHSYHLAQTSLPIFTQAVHHVAHFNASLDPDGALRRVPVLIKLKGAGGLVPSLALETAAVYLGATVEPIYDPEREQLLGARLRREGKPSVVVPLGFPDPYTLIDYPGDHQVFTRVSLSDVVDGTVPAEKLKGKAALLGVELTGLFDQRVTPFNGNEAGVFTHAALVSNILAGRFLTRPWELRLLEIAFMLASSLALGFFLPRARFLWKLVASVALMAAWLVVDQRLFVGARLHVATVLPLVNLGLTSFGIIFLGYLTTDREKSRLRGAFQYYLNESVMEQMLRHPEKLKLGGEKKEMTVLFSDIRGFTTLSERMAPDALVKFINSYLTPMTQIVFSEGGTLDKYIGDALMAFWGAPLDQPDNALRACRAAVRFSEKLEELKVTWRAHGLPSLDIGVGINSGPMIVGNMGSDIRFDYTVMGDAVNLASRLEGTSKTYGVRLLISEATYAQVKDEVVARRLGAVRVKGKQVPVRIYELRGVGRPSETDARAIAAMEAALDAYTAQRFADARTHFQALLQTWPQDPPALRYLEEIAVLETRPKDPNWDGVYTATTK